VGGDDTAASYITAVSRFFSVLARSSLGSLPRSSRGEAGPRAGCFY